MKKSIYLLAILVMISSIVLAVYNRQYLLNVYFKIDQVEERTRVVTADLGGKEDQQDQLESKEGETTDAKNQVEAKLAATRSQLTIINRNIAGQERKIEQAEVEILEFQQMIKRHFPNGHYRSPEQLDRIYQANKARQNSLNTYLQELEVEVDSVVSRNKHQREMIGEEEEIQLEKRRQVLLGELQARVVAINSEYGFVMVNAGSNHGIDSKQTFLVKRGNERIGRLRINYLTEMVCLCDIIAESNTQNSQTRILLGDVAIIETPLAAVNLAPGHRN